MDVRSAQPAAAASAATSGSDAGRAPESAPQPASAPSATDSAPAASPRRPEPVQRWRLVFRRLLEAPVLAQREAAGAWEASLLTTDLPLALTDGERPRPRLAFGASPGGSLAADADLADVWLTERRPAWQVREALAGALPEGHELVTVHDVWLGAPALPGWVVASEITAMLRDAADPGALADACRAMLAAATLPRERRKGDRTVAYDLRPFLDALDATTAAGTTCVVMRLRHDPEKGVGRPDEVLAELGERLGSSLEPVELRRTRLLLAEDVDPDAGQRRRRQPAAATSPRRGRN